MHSTGRAGQAHSLSPTAYSRVRVSIATSRSWSSPRGNHKQVKWLTMELRALAAVSGSKSSAATPAAAELGKEGLRGWRMVREAVQGERRLTIGIATLQRVQDAVRQVSRRVG